MKVSSCVTGIQHLGIPTNDIEKTIAFYESLGFEIASQTINKEADERVAFLSLKNLMIETYQNNSAVGTAGAIDHVAIDVSDVEKAFEIVKKGDYTIIDKDIRFLPFWEKGVRFFNILGPNGEKVEFIQKL